MGIIANVISFANGNVMVFDQNGQQMSEYQGCYADKKENILKDAPPSAVFTRAQTLRDSPIEISREIF